MQRLVVKLLSQKGKPLRQQLGPGAAQCLLKPDDSGHQDVDPARLDLLDRADVQVNQFGEAFLRHGLSGSLAADVRTQLFQLPFNDRVSWHAPLGRQSALDCNGPMGRNRLGDAEERL